MDDVKRRTERFVHSNTVAMTVISRLLVRQPLSPAKISFAWRVAAGPALARATRVALADNGRLLVSATDAHWRRELERSADIVRTRMQRLIGSEIVRTVVVETATAGN
jgi:hypothetical protein